MPGLDREARLDVREDAGVTLEQTLALPDTELVTAPAGGADAALAALNADPDVVYAEPDVQVSLQSNDAQFGGLWGLHNTGQTVWDPGVADADIDAPEAWTTTKGSGATVAVVDTGVEVTHPDLAGQLTGNAGERGDGTREQRRRRRRQRQGRRLARLGLRQQRQHGRDPGQLPRHPRVRDGGGADGQLDRGRGRGARGQGRADEDLRRPGDDGLVVSDRAAFDYAGALGVDVVNASLGGFGYSTTVTNAMLAHPNTLYVVSAGNDSANAADYMPCNSPAANLICVGSSDNRDLRSGFSNTSATAVDLFAPGSWINSTTLGTGYTYANGTSMASPHVAGAAALLAAAQPSATVTQLRAALLGGVDGKAAFGGFSVTGGRLNAARRWPCSRAPLRPPEPPTPTPTPSPTATPADPGPAGPDPRAAGPDPGPTAPTPAPPVTTPTPTPAKATVRALRVTGVVRTGKPARVTYNVSAKTTVRSRSAAPAPAPAPARPRRACSHRPPTPAPGASRSTAARTAATCRPAGTR